ncbi:unnamed protein product [Closterium sp. Yama58-4]|nr:unnamed protein product [Closterium sp. Yama58-4]
MTIPNPIFPSASRADVRSRYQLGRELGKGGGGVVRVCGDVATGEAVAACKSIPKCKLQLRASRYPRRIPCFFFPNPFIVPSPHLPRCSVLCVPLLCSSPHSPVRATAAPRATTTRAHRRPRAQRKEAREELQGEVAAMRRVGGHAHVVALRALFEDAESVHLVMDLCAHGDLYDYLIARTTLPEPLAADVTRQILLALHHCHASGVVHRDIKPENILLAARDDAAGKLHLKLADFGLAVMLRAGQQAVGMYGSAVYMSPEVVCRRPYGPAVDLWGLGVILYTALSGALLASMPSSRTHPNLLLPRKLAISAALPLPYSHTTCRFFEATHQLPFLPSPTPLFPTPAHPLTPCPCPPGYMPFWGSTDEQLFFRILRNQPDFSIAPWPSVAPAAIDLVRWLLSSDPNHRPSAAAALHHPWLAHHCGRITLPSPRPAPAPCVPVGAPGWAGEGGVEGGREGKGEGERVKAAAEAGEGAVAGGGKEGVGSGRGGAAGAAAAPAAAGGGERDTEMGGVEPQRTTWDGATGNGAVVARGEEGDRQEGKQEEQRKEDRRQEQGAGAAAHGSMDVDSHQGASTAQQGVSTAQQGASTAQQGASTAQQGASTAQQGASTAQQGGRQKQPKAPPIQLPLFTSFTGPASPLFSSPTANRSAAAAGSGVFLFTARPASGSASHTGSGGSMWDREGSKAKHKEQQRQQAQRHAHAHKQQQEQQRGAAAAAAAGSKDGHKEGTAKAPVEARLSGPDGSIPVSSLFSFLRPLNPMAARKSSSSFSSSFSSFSRTAPRPGPDSPSSTVPPSFLYSPREPLKSPHHHHSFSATATTSSGGQFTSSSAPRTVAAVASEPSFGLGRLARPLQGMASLMRPASPSASSPALAPSPSESPQHSMGAGTGWAAAARAHTHDDGSTSTAPPRAPLTTSASAPNVAIMPGGSAAASGPGSAAAAGLAVPHAPRRARGLSSIVKAFASLSTAAGPLGNAGSGQQHSGVSMGAVGGGGGRESVRRGEDLHKGQQENGEAVSEGVSSRDSFTWQRQGSWIFRR